MSFPQPSANAYAADGSKFFRIRTPLSSPGDIYESSQSGHAFALGPESDLANINMAYFDDQAPTFMQLTSISPLRTFVGRVDARLDAKFSPAQRPGKLLFWANDIYDPAFRPRGFDANLGDSIQFVPPIFDLIEYFEPVSSLVPAREDKSYLFQEYPFTTRTFFLVIPYYGRKYGFIQFVNRNATDPTTFGISGVNYAITQNGPPNPYHIETVIRAPAAVVTNAQVTSIVTATNAGMFDALVFSLTNVGPAPLRILMSDNPG